MLSSQQSVLRIYPVRLLGNGAPFDAVAPSDEHQAPVELKDASVAVSGRVGAMHHRTDKDERIFAAMHERGNHRSSAMLVYLRTPRAATPAAPDTEHQQHLPRQVPAATRQPVRTLWAPHPLQVRAGRLVAVRLRGE